MIVGEKSQLHSTIRVVSGIPITGTRARTWGWSGGTVGEDHGEQLAHSVFSHCR